MTEDRLLLAELLQKAGDGDFSPGLQFAVYGRSPLYKEFLASTAWSVRTAYHPSVWVARVDC